MSDEEKEKFDEQVSLLFTESDMEKITKAQLESGERKTTVFLRCLLNEQLQEKFGFEIRVKE